jgi:hypothetical protein
MTNKRRTFLITVSVLIGTVLSAGFIYLRRGTLDDHDWFLLGTNLFMSLLIIFGIGFILLWRKKN